MQTNKVNKVKLFAIIGVFILVVAVAAAIVNSPKNRSTQPASIKICTIKADVGIAYVTIVNQNTGGGPNTIMSSDLPYSFNFTQGDTIQVNATSLPEYSFNVWRFTNGERAGTWDRHNPLTFRTTQNIELLATVLLKSENL